jgi:hypothetical protein
MHQSEGVVLVEPLEHVIDMHQLEKIETLIAEVIKQTK